MPLHLDFETRSDIDLKKSGLHVYANGENTDILCAAYAFDDEPPSLWVPGEPCPPRLKKFIELGGEVHAHNAPFERELCNNVASRLYGWPLLADEQLVCTLAMSYAMGLPGHLGSTAAALGIEQQKDMAGQRIMLQYCQPREVNEQTGEITWWEDPEKLLRIYAYCMQDVIVERDIGRRMMRLSAKETEIWRLDQKINDRGIAVDFEAVLGALAIIYQEKKRLTKEIQDVSQGEIATCNAVKQIRDFLSKEGVETGALAKGDVLELLRRPDLSGRARRVLELRQEAGKASTAKLDAMVHGVSPPDYRIRGTFQYSGANTRRWAGRRIQLQNLPRPKIESALVDKILKQIASRKIGAAELDIMFGSPLSVLSNCIRGCLTAGIGKVLVACDFSAIEARVIAWLSGQESTLEIFRGDGKIYEHAASKIFRKNIADISEGERQVGKVAVLALGYQGGVGAFQTMAKGYGVQLAPAFDSLWAVATPEQREWASERFRAEKKNYSDISEKEFIASDLTKVFWRLANANIVYFWGDLEKTAITAINSPGVICTNLHKNIAYKMSGSFLWCRLPSGGVICYPYPQVKSEKDKWGRVKSRLSYMSEDGQSRKWLRFGTYGGSLAENVTQAVARDLLADAMIRLESSGYEIVAHVHDEVVCEVDESYDALESITRIMSEVPAWALGMPIKASGWQGFRYRK